MSQKISGSYNGRKREKYHYMCSAYMRSGGTRCSKHSIRNDELISCRDGVRTLSIFC